MSISACPARDCIVSIGTPWACSWLTKVCRQECGVSGLTPGTDIPEALRTADDDGPDALPSDTDAPAAGPDEAAAGPGSASA